jgi:hypothetical protein
VELSEKIGRGGAETLMQKRCCSLANGPTDRLLRVPSSEKLDTLGCFTFDILRQMIHTETQAGAIAEGVQVRYATKRLLNTFIAMHVV